MVVVAGYRDECGEGECRPILGQTREGGRQGGLWRGLTTPRAARCRIAATGTIDGTYGGSQGSEPEPPCSKQPKASIPAKAGMRREVRDDL